MYLSNALNKKSPFICSPVSINVVVFGSYITHNV